MQPSRQTAAAHPSLWARLGAALCLLLCLQLAGLQSWHTHGIAAAHAVNQRSVSAPDADATDAACPACAALHLAPLAVWSTPQAELAVADAAPVAYSRCDAHVRPGLQQYSRPPPQA